jgi:hypothetical protein
MPNYKDPRKEANNLDPSFNEAYYIHHYGLDPRNVIGYAGHHIMTPSDGLKEHIGHLRISFVTEAALSRYRDEPNFVAHRVPHNFQTPIFHAFFSPIPHPNFRPTQKNVQGQRKKPTRKRKAKAKSTRKKSPVNKGPKQKDN